MSLKANIFFALIRRKMLYLYIQFSVNFSFQFRFGIKINSLRGMLSKPFTSRVNDGSCDVVLSFESVDEFLW